jgi:hypothetical protein
MKKIHQFYLDFITAELEASNKSVLPDITDFNNSLKTMDSFLADSLKTRFGMTYMEEPESADYYEEMKSEPPIQARHLFKIDSIENDNVHQVYSAYVSMVSGKKEYFHCLVAKPKGDTFEVISRFTWGIGRDGSNQNHWYFSGGEEMKYTDLKPVIETLRLLSPDDDEESMKMYLS